MIKKVLIYNLYFLDKQGFIRKSSQSLRIVNFVTVPSVSLTTVKVRIVDGWLGGEKRYGYRNRHVITLYRKQSPVQIGVGSFYTLPKLQLRNTGRKSKKEETRQVKED